MNGYCLVPYLIEVNAIVSVCKEDAQALISVTPHGEVSDHEFSSVEKMSIPRVTVKDVRGWQFLTMKAAETLCVVCLPPPGDTNLLNAKDYRSTSNRNKFPSAKKPTAEV